MMSCLTCALLWGSDEGLERSAGRACALDLRVSLRWQPVIVAQDGDDQNSANCCRKSATCFVLSVFLARSLARSLPSL